MLIGIDSLTIGSQKVFSTLLKGPIVGMVALNENQMHFALGATNFIEYNFAVLPPNIATSQIRNLGDITRLGGEILAGPLRA